jgi:hypothetical protein
MRRPAPAASMDYAAARAHALALPEAVEQPHFAYTSFRVRGKIFLTAPPDGGHLHLFLAEPERECALALHPGLVEKLFWGGKVVGLRLHLAAAPATVVAALIEQAWRHKAPQALALAAVGRARG